MADLIRHFYYKPRVIYRTLQFFGYTIFTKCLGQSIDSRTMAINNWTAKLNSTLHDH